ncbi:MAG: hypothetical protein HY984_02290 [Candidatus Magasanikbacteria bacterium]|nr:hypothetical protein [Candidatus Magasanikbacteria bacterium]
MENETHGPTGPEDTTEMALFQSPLERRWLDEDPPAAPRWVQLQPPAKAVMVAMRLDGKPRPGIETRVIESDQPCFAPPLTNGEIISAALRVVIAGAIVGLSPMIWLIEEINRPWRQMIATIATAMVIAIGVSLWRDRFRLLRK